MKFTPRQKLLHRRDNYLARISIFDSFECEPKYDLRPALVRRFLAGGDDVDPSTITRGTPWPLTRPKLAEDAAREDADFRRNTKSKIKHQNDRSGEADYDQFILFNGGEIDLNRITGVMTRAVDLWNAGFASEPDHLFELITSEVPRMSDSGDVLSRALALLVLVGYNRYDFNVMIDSVMNAADWSMDQWYQKTEPGQQQEFVQLRDRVVTEVYSEINAYFAKHPAWYPQCPPAEKTKEGQSSTAPAPPKDPMGELPADVATALRMAENSLAFAFGEKKAEDIVEGLRAFPLKEDLIIRLLVWVHRSTRKEATYIIPGRTELAPPDNATAAPESGPYQDSGGLRYIPAQMDPAAAKRWESVRSVVLLLSVLGRLNRTTMVEACLRLDCLLRMNLNTDNGTLANVLDKDINEWPDVDEDKFADYKTWLDSMSWTRTRPDFAFLLILSITDNETFKHLWPSHIADDLAEKLYTPPEDALPIDAFYWRHVVKNSTFGHILAWKETADFKVADHIRFLGLFRPGAKYRPEKREAKYERWLQKMIPGWFTEMAVSSLIRFKYWVSDPPTSRDDEEEMTFWSENHQVLFASAEYIAGQWFPEATFRATSNSGKWHQDRAKERLERWLHDRLRFGFAELNSPVYYEEHLQGIFNAADFVEDENLRKLAVMVLDLMVFDIVRRNCQGSFIACSSRVYSNSKSSGWSVSIRDFIELLTGTIGDVCAPNDAIAIYTCTSRYLEELPECLLVIATQRKIPFVDRSRVSISFEDAESYDIGFESGADMIFWWGHSAFFTDKTYRLSQAWADRWHLRSSGPFTLFKFTDRWIWRLLHVLVEGIEQLSLRAVFSAFAAVFPALGIFLYPRMLRFFFDVGTVFLDFIASIGASIGKAFGLLDENDDRVRLAKTMIEQQIEEAAIELNAGSVNERIHFYMWCSEDAMLSSLINEKKGGTSAQKEVNIANLGMNISVFVSKPPVVDNPSVGDIIGDVGLGIVENLEVWKTIPGALDLGGDPVPETTNLLYSVVVPLLKDDILGDGPVFFAGQTSNPLVWQNENVSIAIYSPNDRQRDLSNYTHAYWPWDHFDETAFRSASQGQWIFGRRDRRPAPRTPLPPDPKMRPSEEQSWPDKSRRKETDSPGSGYIALFSAGGMRSTPPGNRDWGAKELICDGHNNVWITIVGDRALYGSFEKFIADVLAAKIDVNRNDAKCSITMPDPGSHSSGKTGEKFELAWTGDELLFAEPKAKIGDERLSTSEWPRFELKPSKLKDGASIPFGIKNRNGEETVKFDETFWRIECKTEQEKDGKKEEVILFLEHDFADIKNPKRNFNQLPEEQLRSITEVNDPFAAQIQPALKPAQSMLGQPFRGRKRFTP